MLVRVQSATVFGIRAIPIDVEVDASLGLPAFNLVGMLSGAVQEAKVRVAAAIRNIGVVLPQKKITVNLAPADMRKDGTGFDLPIAAALLAACNELPVEALEGLFFAGELSLSGELKPLRGVLPLAIEARQAGARGLVVPEANALEASVVRGLEIFPARHFGQIVAWLRGEAGLPARPPPKVAEPLGEALDLSDIAGQAHAKRALEVAAAGGHNLLMFGPPGSGKTMLARRLAGILPSLTFEEALETTVVHSVAGLTEGMGLIHSPPFRAPHHSISDAGLVGGSSKPRPGEASLAHNGILFLDEIAEFKRHVLDSLRQPLEDGYINIVRAGRSAQFPATFMLVAAMNPCPCGFYGARQRPCLCTGHELNRYRHRISGPLLDRIDIQIDVPALPYEALPTAGSGETSAVARARVAAARDAQMARASDTRVLCNARLRGASLRRHCKLDDECRKLMLAVATKLGLTARAHDRILRVARTIADLAGSKAIALEHLAEAVQYRALDRQAN